MSLVRSGFSIVLLGFAAFAGCGDSGGGGGAGSCEDASDCEPVDCQGTEYAYCNRGRCETTPELVCRFNSP